MLGELLKELRIERGLTLKELAERLNTDRGNLSKIERGKRNITWEWVLNYARVLNYKVIVKSKQIDFIDLNK